MLEDITKKAANKGDTVKFFLKGQEFEGKILETTVVHFQREYHVQFVDGSKQWFPEHMFQCLKN